MHAVLSMSPYLLLHEEGRERGGRSDRTTGMVETEEEDGRGGNGGRAAKRFRCSAGGGEEVQRKSGRGRAEEVEEGRIGDGEGNSPRAEFFVFEDKSLPSCQFLVQACRVRQEGSSSVRSDVTDGESR